MLTPLPMSDDVPVMVTFPATMVLPTTGLVITIVGGVLSTTVAETETLLEFPALSVAVAVIVFEPGIPNGITTCHDDQLFEVDGVAVMGFLRPFTEIITVFIVLEVSDALPVTVKLPVGKLELLVGDLIETVI